MLSRYHHLLPDLTIDLDTIDADARRSAEHAMLRPTPGCTTTWQGAYDRAYARLVDIANSHRETALWHTERDAEEARRADLSPRERRILELRETAHLGRMIDDSAEAIAVQDAAERDLANMRAGL